MDDDFPDAGFLDYATIDVADLVKHHARLSDPKDFIDLDALYGPKKYYAIVGDIPQGMCLKTQGSLKISGTVAGSSVLNAQGNIDVDGDLGYDVHLFADAISAHDVGVDCNLEARNGGVTLDHLAKNIRIRAHGMVYFISAKERLNVLAGKELSFTSSGDHSILLAQKVVGQRVGAMSHVTATADSVSLAHAGPDSKIFSAEPADVHVADPTVLVGGYSGLDDPFLASPPDLPITRTHFTPEGCGIYKDSGGNYMLSDAMRARYPQDAMNNLIIELLKII